MSKFMCFIVVILLIAAFALIPINWAKSFEFAIGAFVLYVGYLGLIEVEEVKNER